MNKIATLMALKSRHIGVEDTVCGLCGDGDESVDHLFTSCYMATMIWLHISNWCMIQNLVVFSFKDLLEVHEHVGLIGQKKEVLKGLIRIRCWSILRERNGAIFNNKPVKLEVIISEPKSLGFFLWFSTRTKNTSISWEDWCKYVIL
ncbi:putative reverse transcriptase zinc-binding domain-containing protein [Helianthus debilis subsp. tardiflorus]